MVEKRYQSLDAAINEAMKTGEGALLMFKGLKRGEEFMTINGHGDISKRGEGRISHDTAPYHMIQGHIRPHKVLQAILVHTPRVSVDSLFPTKPEEKASLLVRVRLQCERVAQDDPGSLRGRVRAQPANVLLRCQLPLRPQGDEDLAPVRLLLNPTVPGRLGPEPPLPLCGRYERSISSWRRKNCCVSSSTRLLFSP